MNPKEVFKKSAPLVGALSLLLPGCSIVGAEKHPAQAVYETPTPVPVPTPDIAGLIKQAPMLEKLYKGQIPNGPGYWPLEEVDGGWKLCKALSPINITQEPSIQFKWPTTGAIFTYFSKDHYGIDIAPPYGTPLYAAADGIVVDIQKLGWSYGWFTVIWHWRNNFLTQYAHMSEFDVQVGQPVKAGDLIGRVGSTGRSTGPHVHFSIYANVAGIGCVAFNPLDYLP